MQEDQLGATALERETRQVQVTGSALTFAGTYRWWEDAVKSWCGVDFFLCLSYDYSLTVQFRKPQLTVGKVCLLKFKFWEIQSQGKITYFCIC